jgi:ribose-phosphate pyrophosphokinase
MHKRRTSYNETIANHLVGDIAGHQPVIIDDIIASGSVLKQLDIIYDNGASGQACFAITHPILLPSALEILAKDDRIGKLVVANSLPIPPEKQHPKLEVLSVAPLLAEIIQRVHIGVSTSGKLIKALPIY